MPRMIFSMRVHLIFFIRKRGLSSFSEYCASFDSLMGDRVDFSLDQKKKRKKKRGRRKEKLGSVFNVS